MNEPEAPISQPQLMLAAAFIALAAGGAAVVIAILELSRVLG